MDPLSIATGAASLAAAASTLSLWLYTLVKDIKNVDSKLTALSKEVTQLTGLLTSVESTVRKCHSQALLLAHLDEQIWQQIDNVMVDCKITLEGLDRLVTKIRSDSGTNNFMRLLKKPSMHFKLTTQMDDVSEFMNQTYKLNCALQTALAVFNISLSFRANTSQELLFRELQSLKSFVEEALKASHGTEYGADPFAARLSRNLHSLAKAAQQFHSTASSTASTRYDNGGRMSNTSNWSGSDSFRLTEPQRERIERWNQQLQAVEEGQEDNTTTTDETLATDNSTVITIPDLEEKPVKLGKQAEKEQEGSDDDDDDSDIELDFLKNFDELACTSFARKDYSKSEQFLRKAMERSTGESSGETDFKLLRIRLAICCCLQDKWEFAAGALVPLSKSKTASNLPVFHLLQAIALGYLANNRFDDAHSVCKTALQGKKKILGKTSDDFHECLSMLALIYEKKGDSLEAEAVRLSIPEGWTPSTPESTRSGKQYILDHKNLIDLAFGKKSARTTHPSSPNAPVDEGNLPKSGHWTTLVPRGLTDGLRRATKDEKIGAPIGNTDTGKEFILQDREELIPRRRTETGVLRAINDEYSGKQVGEFDSGKEVTVDIPGNGISEQDKFPVELPTTESKKPEASKPDHTYPGIKFEPWWPMPQFCTWQIVQTPRKEIIREKVGPDWYSTLELVSQIAAPKITTSPSEITYSGRSSWNFEKAVDIRSQDSLVTGFVIDLNQTTIDAADPTTVSCSVGVGMGLGDASIGMSHGHGSEILCISFSKEPGLPVSGSSASSDLWIDYPWNFLRMLLTHDEGGDSAGNRSLFPGRLIATKCPDWMDNFEAAATTSSRLEDLETAIARWVGEITGSELASGAIAGVAVSVPDVLLRRAAKVLSYRLAANSLLKCAKLLPSSLVIAYYFIKSKAVSLEHLKAQAQKPGVLVVLNCDEILVECTSYSLKVLEGTRMELSPTGSAAEDLFGGMNSSLHAELEFAKIALSQLTDIMARFKVKFTAASIESMIQSCREYFRKQILQLFINDGRKWVAEVAIPQGIPGAEQGRLEFSNEMVLECFQPSMRSIRKMMITSILKLYDAGSLPSHVLLAGQYASSSFLHRELRAAVVDLGIGTRFLVLPDGAFASTIGAVNYLDDVSFLQSLDSLR